MGERTVQAAQRLQPSDLVYMGAFRLPDGASDIQSWKWGGYAMTYYPGGDPNGPDDGYPGSIYGAGHAREHRVSEISIPVPVISASKNLGELNTASTLQAFRDIFNVSNLEMPRTGLAYLPKQNQQTTGKLYLCKGQHLHEEGVFLTHEWCELNLSAPSVQGTWYLNLPHQEYNTNDYIFDIPYDWAAANTPADVLATGRYRDGGWSGQGPSLFVFGPYNQGNPPASGEALPYVTLLRYTSNADPDSEDESTNHTMDNYHHSDEWSGASWITAGEKAAVVFVGTKGTGDCWYGLPDGTVWPEEPPYPQDPEGQRGWWSTEFVGQFIFYDSEDLAKAAAGTMKSWEPQPYATLNVDQYLYQISTSQDKEHLGAACFDRANGLFYVFEPLVDDDKPIVHVWKVDASPGAQTAAIALNRSRLDFGAVVSAGDPDSQTVSIENSGTGDMNWWVTEDADWLSCSPDSGTGAGVVTVSVDISGLSAGTYNGAVTVGSLDASNSPQTVAVTLNVYAAGSSELPFGIFATPGSGAAVSSSVPFTGWALDDTGVQSVKIYRRDGGTSVYIGDAVFVEGARPDVEAAYPGYPMNYRAGWGYMMLTNFLPNNGNGTFTFDAVATDNEGNRVTLGTTTVTCDNANAVKPFGAIDTPAQGGTASGTAYRNQGWVLTPMPNSIPTDGSTIHVIVDGVDLGQVFYNIYRSDIAALFPGYANSSGAAAYFDLDTTAYANGVHTIAWSAVDNAGNADGIGSRYFTIQNSTQEKKGTIEGVSRFEMMSNEQEKPRAVEIRELERVEVEMSAGGGWTGYMMVGNRLEKLPVGSTLNAEQGVFYWLPGPGFLGNYDFIFIRQNGTTVEHEKIRITITPKFKKGAVKNEK